MTSYFVKYDVIFFTTSYHIETQYITDTLFLHGILLGNGVETGGEITLKNEEPTRYTACRLLLFLCVLQMQKCSFCLFFFVLDLCFVFSNEGLLEFVRHEFVA